jgi:hypothetical protein
MDNMAKGKNKIIENQKIKSRWIKPNTVFYAENKYL